MGPDHVGGPEHGAGGEEAPGRGAGRPSQPTIRAHVRSVSDHEGSEQDEVYDDFCGDERGGRVGSGGGGGGGFLDGPRKEVKIHSGWWKAFADVAVGSGVARCLPIHNFTHVYDYLFSVNSSFVTR